VLLMLVFTGLILGFGLFPAALLDLIEPAASAWVGGQSRGAP
jgi:hypothetical protein